MAMCREKHKRVMATYFMQYQNKLQDLFSYFLRADNKRSLLYYFLTNVQIF